MKLCQLAPRIAASLKAFHDLSEKCFNIGSGCQDTNSLWRDKHTREVEVREHRARVECLERLSIIGERLGDRFFLSCHTYYVLRLPNFFAAASRRDGYTMALEEAQVLHLLREFDEEFLIPFEMMNLCRIAARKFAHRFDALPIGDRHELGFVLAVLAQHLDTERLFAERLDTDFIVVGFVLVGVIARGSPACGAVRPPSPRPGGLHFCIRTPAELRRRRRGPWSTARPRQDRWHARRERTVARLARRVVPLAPPSTSRRRRR